MAAGLVGLAVVVLGTGVVQVVQAGHDADQRDELIQVVDRACDQGRAPADVCAAGRVAAE